MLAEDIGVHLLLVDGIQLGKAGAEPDGVENGSRAEHLPLGKPRHFGEYIRENIHRIGNNHIDGVGSMLHDFRRNALDDVHIGLRQIDTGLTGFSADPGSDDDDVRTFRVLIRPFVDLGRR